MPQSAVTTDRPPSVTINSTGTSEPVVRISRQRSRAWRELLAAVDEDQVGLGSVEERASLGREDLHLVAQQRQAGEHLGGGLQRAGQQQQCAHGSSSVAGAEV